MSEEKKPKKGQRKTEEPTHAIEPKFAEFPTEEFINPWGFIHLSRSVLEAFAVPKSGDAKKPYEKTSVTVDMQEGVPIIRKA